MDKQLPCPICCIILWSFEVGVMLTMSPKVTALINLNSFKHTIMTCLEVLCRPIYQNFRATLQVKQSGCYFSLPPQCMGTLHIKMSNSYMISSAVMTAK